MLDPVVVEECAQCLAGAAVYEGGDAAMALTATALARDLADAHGTQAAALLDAASREVIAYLDASELRPESFAAALCRVARIRGEVDAMLIDSRAAAVNGLAL